MNSDELIDQIRVNLVVDAASLSDYTDPRVLKEANDTLTTTFEKAIVSARSGYWQHSVVYSVVTGRSKYRIPGRAAGGVLEQVEIAASVGDRYVPLDYASQEQSFFYEAAAQTTGIPLAYTIRGDQVVLLPSPDNGNYRLRLSYYIRPSRMVRSQSSTLVGDLAIRGRITNVNTATRQITVNALPFDQLLVPPAVVTTAVQNIDVVGADGWHELRLVNATQTITGLIFTVGGTDDLSEIENGDFVRVADQTDWPALPDDFHRPLADLAAATIAGQIGMSAKKATLTGDAAEALRRFGALVTPRTKADPVTIPLGGGWGGASRASYPRGLR